MDVDEIEARLTAASRGLSLVSNRAYKLSRSPFFFLHRKRLMALSDDINTQTAIISALATQAPPAISSALSTAAASGGDPNAPAAVTSLTSAVSNLVSGLQAVVPGT